MKSWLLLPLAAAILAVVPVSAQGQKAKCAVSGKEIEITDKTPRIDVQGKAQYFCCENCPKAFAKTPEKFVKKVGNCPVQGAAVTSAKAEDRKVINNSLWYVCCAGCKDAVASNTVVLKELRDVVSGKTFKPAAGAPRSTYKDQVYIFETKDTQAAFDKEPAKYAIVFGS
jgi:YHS domain-containing protein